MKGRVGLGGQALSLGKDTGCAMRTVADVSAVADPNTGVAVFGPVAAVVGYDGPTGLGTPTDRGFRLLTRTYRSSRGGHLRAVIQEG
jgi:hypothetical protein